MSSAEGDDQCELVSTGPGRPSPPSPTRPPASGTAHPRQQREIRPRPYGFVVTQAARSHHPVRRHRSPAGMPTVACGWPRRLCGLHLRLGLVQRAAPPQRARRLDPAEIERAHHRRSRPVVAACRSTLTAPSRGPGRSSRASGRLPIGAARASLRTQPSGRTSCGSWAAGAATSAQQRVTAATVG